MRHLGAVIGSDTYRHQYTTEKVKNWCDEIETLSHYAKSQPQAAYAAFTHGQQHKFSYFMRTISEMENCMIALDQKIQNVI